MELNFTNGGVSFLITKGSINYGNNKFIYLFNYTSKEGYLRVAKNKGNGIEVNYMFFNSGHCKLEGNTEGLDDNEEHSIRIVWSISEGFVKLFIDNVEKQNCEIRLDTPPILNNSS